MRIVGHDGGSLLEFGKKRRHGYGPPAAKHFPTGLCVQVGLLQKFSGAHPLKELFWSHLNYDRMSQRASRRGWPESAASVLVDDPTLLAASGKDGDFKVLYARLAKERR